MKARQKGKTSKYVLALADQFRREAKAFLRNSSNAQCIRILERAAEKKRRRNLEYAACGSSSPATSGKNETEG